MKDAGVDTEAVVRTGMVRFMEGAMIHGIFHGDLHGGNLFVQPDGRTALLDFGIVGRLSEPRRLAFLRLLMSATANDIHGQLGALRDLGALPPDTDLDAVIRDLGFDKPVVDPTTMDADELVNEIQKTIKALLGIGARLPKELMLFIKNMVFLDGAIATLAPDLDIIGEIGQVSMHFARQHGERLAADLGMDMGDAYELDLTGMKAGFGLDASVEGVTYRELQQRREIIRDRLQKHDRKTRRRTAR
jgi:ubiquinone biosynthesis protein